tara:strand:- start:53 stop:238 length:186 start_codon:yes stop_codon:yes gene_type:complete
LQVVVEQDVVQQEQLLLVEQVEQEQTQTTMLAQELPIEVVEVVDQRMPLQLVELEEQVVQE